MSVRGAVTRLLAAALLLGAVAFLLRGATGLGRPRASSNPKPGPFREVTQEAGLDFRPGLPEGLLNIREIAGSGCGFLDYDRDGHLDILLLGWDRTGLYHSDGQGHFRDVTAGSRLPGEGQWIGMAVGDYDNDGYPDLFLSGYECAALLRNEGGRRFRDVTAASGLSQTRGEPLFATGSTWGDYDRDGRLDLYVARYLHFKEGMTEHCPSSSGALDTCNPDHYQPQRGSLYRNLGGGRFADVTEATGAGKVSGKCWGPLFFDYNEDGWPDLFLANDEVPGDLLRNDGGRRFTNVGVTSGVAFDADGRVHGAMGCDAGDYDQDGHLDLVVTTFLDEAFSLYRNNGDETFTDRSLVCGIGVPTYPMVGWGTRLLDYDGDGWRDLVFANGHATDSSRYRADRNRLQQPLQLFRNEGKHFTAVSLGALNSPMLARGLAEGDYDNDGDPDLLVMDLHSGARLLRNELPRAASGGWIGFELAGSLSNRDAVGARVEVKAGGTLHVAEVRSGGSLFSANDSRVLFGLGSAAAVEQVEIRWPSGQVTRLDTSPMGRYTRMTEPRGSR